MKINPACPHCLLARVHYEAQLSTDDEELQHKAVIGGIDVLNEIYKRGVTSGSVATLIHRKAYEILNDNDPYFKVKQQSNRAAKRLLPFAHSLIHEGNPDTGELFKRAVLASVIGNYFDFGILEFNVTVDMFDRTFTELFERGLDVDDTPRMLEMLDNVVYVADNCGEIVLDTLVFDVIRNMGYKVTLVVRGSPILTDVTMEDVRTLGIDKKVDHVLTTGSNAVGVCFEEAPDELLEAFDSASLIISKGMANYETLSERKFRPIAYMLRTKCQSVASDMGIEVGYSVAKLLE